MEIEHGRPCSGAREFRLHDGSSIALDNEFRTETDAQGCGMEKRLEVRVTAEHRQRLEALARERAVTISAVVRSLIDEAYEDILRARRKQAADELIALNLEDPPDPDVLSRELEAAHDPGGLH